MRRAFVYVAEVQHPEVTPGDRHIGVYVSMRKAKAAVQEFIAFGPNRPNFGWMYGTHGIAEGPEPLSWTKPPRQSYGYDRYQIAAYWESGYEDTPPFSFTIIAERPQ
jgi:hypothetical protein